VALPVKILNMFQYSIFDYSSCCFKRIL